MNEHDAMLEDLRQWAATAAELFDNLKGSGIPEQLACDLTYAWWVASCGDDV